MDKKYIQAAMAARLVDEADSVDLRYGLYTWEVSGRQKIRLVRELENIASVAHLAEPDYSLFAVTLGDCSLSLDFSDQSIDSLYWVLDGETAVLPA